MVSVTSGDGNGNVGIDTGHALCFPLRDGDGNASSVQGRASRVPIAQVQTQVEDTGPHDTQHTSHQPSSLDNGHGLCGGGEGKHNQGRVSRLTENVRCAKGSGKEDPTSRACEKATGPIPRVSGPVPNCRCNLSWVSIPESILVGWQNDGVVQCPSCKRFNPERVYNYLNASLV